MIEIIPQASVANICDGECLNILWEILCRIPSSSSSFHPLRFWPGPVFVSLFSSFPLFSCSVLGLAAASGRPQAASGGLRRRPRPWKKRPLLLDGLRLRRPIAVSEKRKRSLSLSRSMGAKNAFSPSCFMGEESCCHHRNIWLFGGRNFDCFVAQKYPCSSPPPCAR